MHECEYPGCGAEIEMHLFMCPVHWRAVPPDLQKDVYRTWRMRRNAVRTPHYAQRRQEHEEAKRKALLAIT